MIRDGKNSAEIATELGRTRAAVMNRKQVLGVAQKMTAARGSKMPYTAYDKKRTTNTGVKNAKQGIDLKAELDKEIEAGNLPSPRELLEAASSKVEVEVFEKKIDNKKINQAIKAAKAYNKRERRETEAMVQVSKALNKIINGAKKKHRKEFVKALKKTNNFPLISELVQ